MSTRGIIIFKDEKHTFSVYKHWDGHPFRIFQCIKDSLKLSLEITKFDPSEFSCAFIAANKDGPGGIYLCENDGNYRLEEYVYEISLLNKKINVKIFEINENWERIPVFEGDLKSMKKYVKKECC